MSYIAKRATPVFHSKRTRRRTYGGEVAAYMSEWGKPPLPWQKRALNVLLEYDSDGFRFPQSAVSIPRQSGKSVLMLGILGWFMHWRPGAKCALVAQDRRAAAERLWSLGEWMVTSGEEAKVTYGMGNERITLPNGSEAYVVSTTRAAGHGDTLDLVLLDEAWQTPPWTLQALVPAQIAVEHPLRIAISTAGDEDSSVWNDMLEAGRAAVSVPDARFGFVEYAPKEGVDVFKESSWPSWMPALGHTVSVQNIRDGSAALGGVGSGEWLRAYGNVTTRSDHSLFTVPQIDVALEPVGKAPDDVVYGIDVGRGPDAASIAAAWLGEDGHVYGRLLSRRVEHRSEWIVDELEGYLSERIGTVVMGYGPSIVLKPAFEELCKDHGVDLVDMNTTAVAGAAMRFVENLRAKNITVQDVQDVVRDAMLSARAKSAGDRFRFDTAVLTDQTPLLAVSLAADQAWSEQFTPTVSIY